MRTGDDDYLTWQETSMRALPFELDLVLFNKSTNRCIAPYRAVRITHTRQRNLFLEMVAPRPP